MCAKASLARVPNLLHCSMRKGGTQDLLPSTSRLSPFKRTVQYYLPQDQNLVHPLRPHRMHQQIKCLTSGMPASDKTVCIIPLFRRSASTEHRLFIYRHSVAFPSHSSSDSQRRSLGRFNGRVRATLKTACCAGIVLIGPYRCGAKVPSLSVGLS